MFVGNGYSYHRIDWNRNAQRLCAASHLLFATAGGDLIKAGERDS